MVMGHESSGKVIEVGEGVTDLKPGVWGIFSVKFVQSHTNVYVLGATLNFYPTARMHTAISFVRVCRSVCASVCLSVCLSKKY